MNKKKLGVLLLVIVLAISASGCLKREVLKEEKKDLGKIVVTEEVKLDNLNDIYSTIGLTEANKTYMVSGQAGSEVKEVFVTVGDIVEKDEVLFSLESDITKRDVDKNKKSLLTQLEQAQLSYNNAKDAYNDNLKLFNSGAISKSILNSTKLQFDNAELSLSNAQSSYYNTVENLDEQLNNKSVKSPIQGIVTESSIIEGSILSGQTHITVMDLEKIKINATVNGEIINKIKVGQEVLVNFKSIDLEVESKIESISYVGSRSSYPIKIVINNKNGIIKPGMYSDLEIVLDKYKNIVTIPKEAILSDEKGEYIYINKDNVAKKMYIKSSLTIDGMVGIESGVKKGDMIVIKGQSFIKDNDKLRK